MVFILVFKVLRLKGFPVSSVGLASFRGEAEVLACPNGDDVAFDAGVGQVMRLECNATLFAIKLRNDFAGAELNVKVGSLLVENVAVESGFHLVVPDCFGVKVQVVVKPTCDHDFVAKLCLQFLWNCQAVFVV